MIFFRVGLEKVITLPPPKTLDIDEVEEVKRIVAVRTPDQVESILNHDQVPFYAIREVCNKHGLEFHTHEFNQIVEESAIIIRKFKDHFNRDRPVEVYPELNTLPKKFIHKPWELPNEEAYKINFNLKRDYYEPIVNHVEARQAALNAFEHTKKK